jgi:hypothetical protein
VARHRLLKAGRRSGKTSGLAIASVEAFLAAQRVLYGTPTMTQLDRWWFEVSTALAEPVRLGYFKKNETEHLIERVGTEQALRGKTCWAPDHLRGDFCHLLILDELQLIHEDTLGVVGMPMLLDRGGRFIGAFTPPSLRSLRQTKATDPRHASTLFAKAQADTSGRWAVFHFTSHDNPYLSQAALAEITQDMSQLAYRNEILALETAEIPGALWTQHLLDETRVAAHAVPDLARIAIALDPAATSGSTADEMGLVALGKSAAGHGYVLRDASMRGTPEACARQALVLYDTLQADILVGEVNNGGEWIGTVLFLVAKGMHERGERLSPQVNYKQVHASRGKQTRAEPISALFEHGKIHLVGVWPELEEQLTTWVPGMASPDRLDSLTWAATELFLEGEPKRIRAWGR